MSPIEVNTSRSVREWAKELADDVLGPDPVFPAHAPAVSDAYMAQARMPDGDLWVWDSRVNAFVPAPTPEPKPFDWMSGYVD